MKSASLNHRLLQPYLRRFGILRFRKQRCQFNLFSAFQQKQTFKSNKTPSAEFRSSVNLRLTDRKILFHLIMCKDVLHITAIDEYFLSPNIQTVV